MSSQETIILAILSETERYGYELYKIIKDRRLDFWQTIAMSSVYAILQKLTRKGYVNYRDVPGGGRPARRLFGISETGRRALESALTENVDPKSVLLGRFEVMLAVWPILSDDRRRELLTSYRGYLSNRRDELRRLADGEINPVSRANFERPLRIVKAELGWLEEFGGNMGIL